MKLASQVIVGATFAVWLFVTICYYDQHDALNRKLRTQAGHILFSEYTPPAWQRLIKWATPIWLLLLLISALL